MIVNPDWLNEIIAAIGEKSVSRDPLDLESWLTDWRGRYTGKAAALVSPSTTQDVAKVVEVAARHGIALVPQGGNSGMVGGATPNSTGRSILLSLRRMNKIRDIMPDSQLAICDAGVILQNFHEALEWHSQRFPLTLGGKGSATIGGLVSTNAGGTQVLRHGTMRALVAGIEAVLPDGSIFSDLGALKKDNRGYDLKQLLIGGEGTIGVVTAATLKTVPALVDRCVSWIGVDSPQQAFRLFSFLNARISGAMEGFEIVPDSCLGAVLEHIPGTRSPLRNRTKWNVLVEVVRDNPDAPDPRDITESLLSAALEKGLALDAVIGSSEAQAEDFWKIRDSIAEAERATGPALQHDISVPVRDMADFISNASPKVEAAFPGTQVAAFGHMGDGNVHFHVKAPAGAGAEWNMNAAKTISAMVYDLVTASGGSISAEHGIGQNKVSELQRLSDPARLFALTAIKSAFDPANIMNPGKLVPLAPDAEVT